jgi:hypothetical protein
LTQLNWIFQFVFPISVNFLLIYSMRNMWILLFLSESCVILLSVYMVAVLSSVFRFSVYYSACTNTSSSLDFLCNFCLTCTLDVCVFTWSEYGYACHSPYFWLASISKYLNCTDSLIVFCKEVYRFCVAIPISIFHDTINQCFLYWATFNKLIELTYLQYFMAM